MKKAKVLVLMFVLSIFFAQPVIAQNADDLKELRKDIQELKKGQESIKKDIDELKGLMRQTAKAAQPAPPAQPTEAVVSIDDDPFKGEKTAKLTIIEFSDYQWPFCAKHVRETMPKLEEEYIKNGKLKYVFRDFPLNFHKNAMNAAKAASCAGEQGKYWEMHNRLFEDQKALEVEDLMSSAEKLGLDTGKFKECFESDKYEKEANQDMADGKAAGIRGTPSFFVGVTNPDSKDIKGKYIRGAQPYAAFKQTIDELLAEGKK